MKKLLFIHNISHIENAKETKGKLLELISFSVSIYFHTAKLSIRKYNCERMPIYSKNKSGYNLIEVVHLIYTEILYLIERNIKEDLNKFQVVSRKLQRMEMSILPILIKSNSDENPWNTFFWNLTN